MKVQRSVNIDLLSRQLAGDEKIAGVEDVWRSRVRALSRALTFVESHPLLAPLLLAHKKFEGAPSNSRVVGITGLPGAGKSSLTNLLVAKLRAQNKTVAVLAVDPSSTLTGGAVLGDRVRMQEHFRDAGVFIRSMGSRGALGGVARSTRGAIRMCGLLNFDFILVETVGIGQSESEIVELADTTALVLMPNSGDEVQLMKAGILQLADIYIVNKSDLASPARMISEIHENTAPADVTHWCPPVLATSTTENTGLDEVVKAFFEHALYEANNVDAQVKRRQRIKREVLQTMHALAEPALKRILDQLSHEQIQEIALGQMPAMAVAHRLLNEHFPQLAQTSQLGEEDFL